MPPTPCPEHEGKPQISCPSCYTDEELQGMISKLQEVHVPASPAQARKPKRLDETKSRKRTWRDELFE